jgi:polysaccharide biosynthesis protein VpsJ
MAGTMASAGNLRAARTANSAQSSMIFKSIGRLSGWLVDHDYKGYDTFDGLSSPILRPLTFETVLGRTVLLQGIRRFPLNLRPLVGIGMHHSSKGMGFLARGFIRLHQSTGDQAWADKAVMALDWLMERRSPGYGGACWGNHFDYQSRGFYLPKGVPTIVWTSLIGHAFLDAYEHFEERKYLETAVSACEHIMRDLETFPDGDGVCITYVPGKNTLVHNANTLGASLLARAYSITLNEGYRDLARKAIQYTAQYQRPDGSWWYGEKENLHWVDNFHSAYVLDCFKHYTESTGDRQFVPVMMKGYEYWKEVFFLPDGTPRYYDYKTLPLDIQCCSQAIDTLVFFEEYDRDSIPLAVKIAQWTIRNMQGRSGCFYYRRYSPWIVNKTPTLHWGQATMMCALAGLYSSLERRSDS